MRFLLAAFFRLFVFDDFNAYEQSEPPYVPDYLMLILHLKQPLHRDPTHSGSIL